MNVKDLLIETKLKVSPHDELKVASELLMGLKARGVTVVNDVGVAVGVVSRSDLFNKNGSIHIPTYIKFLKDSNFQQSSQEHLPYAAGQLMKLTCADVMNQNIFFAHEDTSLETVSAVLQEGGQEIVPVTTSENKFIGVIEISDLLRVLSAGTPAPQLTHTAKIRPIDQELGVVQSDISSKFSYIARSRARLWLTITIVLFVIGFGLGIVFIVDPAPIMESITENLEIILERF